MSLLCFTPTTFTQFAINKKKSGDRLTSICRALVSAVTRITTFSRTLCGFERCCGAFQTGAGVVRLGVRAGRRWGRGEPVLSPNLIGDKATFLPPRTRLPPQVDLITNHFIARSGADDCGISENCP